MKIVVLIISFLLMFQLGSANLLKTRDNIVTASQNQIRFNPAKSDTLLISDTVWSEFVNRSIIQVGKDGLTVHKEKICTTYSGTWSYLLDTAVIKTEWVVKLRSKTMVPLKFLPVPFLEDIGLDTTLGFKNSPQAYWMHEDSIHFYPTPVKVDSFLVGYESNPRYLAQDTAQTDVPLEYREAIIFYTCFLAKTRLAKYEEASWFEQKYRQKIVDYLQQDALKFDIAGQK